VEYRQRLRALARRLNRDDLGFDIKDIPQLKQAIDEDRALKEAELADLTDAESELTDIETVAASYAGGPDGPDGEDNHGNQE